MFHHKGQHRFRGVVEACAVRKEGEYPWLISEIREAAIRLHELGWAHSMEMWAVATEDQPSALVGGLYGVAIGGLFSGESMFNRQPDASKVAFAALVDLLRDDGRDGEGRLIDVQLRSPHMASLGAFDVPREEYMARLEQRLRYHCQLCSIPRGSSTLVGRTDPSKPGLQLLLPYHLIPIQQG